ncbi:HAMP domain-containing histidine kinase [Ktedonosporobacter rubrisoli]|uniref:histidine kinase n=1 Tax=Ktedonosporobacter rubrisoli TaxID=2509675 RepID=A0A4P6K247_KTERU|nr:HAMP domain-containing sensor histidine kinase [Ktedonosporobacter rubrisoli]QBD81962.1 HAMP domain-containing histidine kinase [Ktedonosporobacter rubrisoli]
MLQRLLRMRSISPPGIRVQLALWYTIVSAGLLLIFSIAFYTTLQNMLASSFDTELKMRAQQAADAVTFKNGHLTVYNIMDEVRELDANAVILEGTDDADDQVDTDHSMLQYIPHHDTPIFVKIFDTQGKILYQTSTFKGLKTPTESLDLPLHGAPWQGTANDPKGQPIRVYSTMLVSQNHIVGVVQIGQSLAPLDDMLRRILIGFLIICPLILLLSAFGSYWLAGRAFRPIQRLANTAREIGAKDLHQRVSVPLARDEVRDLAVIFNRMIERLERAFAQQRRFVADASHELRTPVAVIRNMTEVALAQPDGQEDYGLVLQEVNAESERLGRLINDLLALARADEGHVKLDHDPVRLDLLTADVVASMETLATERNIEISTRRLDPATVLGDAARLIQVIMSLVDNALIYTNRGGQIFLSVETCGSHVHIIVQDTGIGIAKKDLDHIFERFYRADPARSKAVGGSGLGLALVEWMVHAHKGIVTVESQPGKGSTFIVTLPSTVASKEEVLVS